MELDKTNQVRETPPPGVTLLSEGSTSPHSIYVLVAGRRALSNVGQEHWNYKGTRVGTVIATIESEYAKHSSRILASKALLFFNTRSETPPRGCLERLTDQEVSQHLPTRTDGVSYRGMGNGAYYGV